MDAHTLAIPLGFIVMAAIVCWYVIKAKAPWQAKLVLVVSLPTFGLVVWKALPSYQGWPTSQTLPEKAAMMGGAIHEPRPGSNDTGAIYLWLVPLKDKVVNGETILSYDRPNGEPRAYRLPYSRRMHERMAKAMMRMKDRKSVV